MARMSVDDTIARDPRVTLLASVLGWSRRETVGCLICDVWPICYDQRTWLVSERVIDAAAAHVGFAAALIECELATRDRGGKLRITGAKKRIEYLNGKTNAGRQGGLKSAESRRKDPKQTSSTPGSTPQATRNLSVTAYSPVPDPVQEEMSGKPDAGLAFAEKAIALINQHAGTKYRPDSVAVIKLVKALIRNRYTPEQAEKVIASKREWVGDPKMGQFFRPATLLAAENFAKYLDDIEAGAGSSKAIRIAAPEDDHPQTSHLLMLGGEP